MTRHSRNAMIIAAASLFGTITAMPSFAQANAPAPKFPGWPEKGLPSPVIPGPFGICSHGAQMPGAEHDLFTQAGYSCARTDLIWNNVEKSPGVYDFSQYDAILTTYIQSDIRPMIIVAYGNKLYNSNKPPTDAASVAAFAKFSGAAAAHFKGHGVLWEIWNEPNSQNPYWKLSAQDYTTLAIATAKAIRDADPTAIVLGPASSKLPWKYYETCFKNGLLHSIDAVSIHPYRDGAPESAAPEYARLNHLIAAYTASGDPIRPVVVSEWGYSTQTPGGVPLEQQARYETRMWLSNLAAGVPLSIWYDWRNDGINPKDNESNFGNVNHDGTPKPAYNAAKVLIQDLNGYTFVHQLPGKLDTDHTLLFRKDTNVAIVTWSSDPQASDDAQTPKVRHVSASDSDFASLRSSANIAYANAPVQTNPEHPGALAVTLSNPGTSPSTVKITLAGHTETVALEPKAQRSVAFALPVNLVTDGSQATLPVSTTWNGQSVTLPPVLLQSSYPLSLSVVPVAAGLRADLSDLQKRGFTGTLRVTNAGKTTAVKANLAAGGTQTVDLAVDVSQPSVITAVNAAGATMARLGPISFVPIAGFPTTVGAGDKSPFHVVQVTKATPKPQQAYLSTVAVDAGPNAPVASAISFSIPADPNVIQTNVSTWSKNPMPENATAIVYWMKSNAAGPSTAGVFVDSDGQNFQANLGALTDAGWRQITIPFVGEMWHWGGAKDGVMRGPFSLSTLLIVDSVHSAPTAAEVKIAAPYFAIGEPAEPMLPGS